MQPTLLELSKVYQKASSRSVFFSLLTLGVLSRIIWISLVDTSPVSDTMVYLSRAMSIAAGEGYVYPDGKPTAYWPVGYPAFLGSVLWLAQGSLLAGKLVNIVLYIVTAFIFFRIARLYQKTGIGLFIIGYLSLSPNHIAYANLYASEPLALFFVSLVVYLLIRIVKQSSAKLIICAALATAFGAFVKPQIVIFPGAVLLLFALLHRRPAHLGHLAIIALTTIVMVIPWGLRNYEHFDAVVPVSNNGGINLYIGNNPHASGGYKYDDEVVAPLEGLDETERDKKAKKLAIEFIRDEPVTFIKMIPLKLIALYKTDAEGIAWNLEGIESPSQLEKSSLHVAKWAAQIPYMLLVVLAVPCVIYTARQCLKTQSYSQFIPVLAVFAGTFVYMVFFGTTRFHFVFLPFLFFYIDYAFGSLRQEART
ncbi:glycosyltransferase family 39 protein [Marinobacter sp. HL-58]|uniref:ArnT family glycosyltransferase n=1 Tax=Marinobacter sp. HL-58 TaxID=1479237 RepID=UPI000484625A|nr:glycosyltransferase family 39 protein [Marinobacter sp. HL-58]KPQ01358.1 MAG: 4-amino-4-deoxy-L-arabinose transferase and related glycosyltransferases of PMT family [Marinobacter sp. HL-58]